MAVRLLEALADRDRHARAGRGASPRALADVRWPARLEWLRACRQRRALLIDAAHNPAGAARWRRTCRTPAHAGAHARLRGDGRQGRGRHGRPAAAVVGRVRRHRGATCRSGHRARRCWRRRSAALGPADLVVDVAAEPARAVAARWRCRAPVLLAGSIYLIGSAARRARRQRLRGRVIFFECSPRRGDRMTSSPARLRRARSPPCTPRPRRRRCPATTASSSRIERIDANHLRLIGEVEIENAEVKGQKFYADDIDINTDTHRLEAQRQRASTRRRPPASPPNGWSSTPSASIGTFNTASGIASIGERGRQEHVRRARARRLLLRRR